MAEDTRKRIFEVEVDAEEALKRLGELKLRAAELREELDALGKKTKDNANEWKTLSDELKSTENAAQKYQKAVTSNIQAETKAKNSIKSLRSELDSEAEAFAALSDSVGKDALGGKIAETTGELQKQEEVLDKQRASTGDYEEASKSLRTELRELTGQLQQLAAEGDTSSEAFRALTERAQELKGVQNHISALVGGETSMQTVTTALTGSVGMLVNAWVLAKNAGSALGIEDEKLNKVMSKLSVVLAALNTVTTIQNALNKNGNLYRTAQNLLQAIGIKQTQQQTAATAALTAAETAEAAATETATFWQTAWNAVMAANPVVLITMGIVALVAAIGGLVKAFSNNSKAAKEAAAAHKEYEQTLSLVDERVTNLTNSEKAYTEAFEAETNRRVATMLKEGKSQEQIDKYEKQRLIELTKAQVDYSKQRLAQYTNNNVLQKKWEEVQAQAALVDSLREGSKQWQKQFEILQDLNAEYGELRATYNSLVGEVEAGNRAIAQSIRDISDDDRKAAQDAADAAYDAAVEASKGRQAIREDELKYNNTWRSDDKGEELRYQAALFEEAQAGEIERLRLAKEYGKITEDQYNAEYASLMRASRQFYADMSKSYDEYVQDATARIKGLLGGSTMEDELREIEDEYKAAMDSLATIEMPIRVPGMTDEEYARMIDDWEAVMADVTETGIRLQEAMDKKMDETRAKYRKQQEKQIKSDIELEYDEELSMAVDNARKTAEVRIKMLEEEIARRKELSLSTYEQEAELNKQYAALRRLDYETELAEAGRSARAQYEAKKKYLELELEACGDNADEQARIYQELAELEQEEWERRIESLNAYMDKAAELFSAFNDLSAQLAQNRIDRINDEYDEQYAALESSLNKGLITQSQYDKRVQQLQEEQAAKTAELERKQAQRDKALSIFETVIDTAQAIMKALSSTAPPASYIFAATAAAIGAAQLATIMAEPLPKASKGKYLSGPSHAGGGIQVEAEGGEAIINKKSTSMFLPLLSAINEAGGGVPFTTSGSDGGYVARSAGMSYEWGDLTPIVEAIEDLTVVVAVEDIQRETNRYVKVEQRGTY